MRGIRTIDWLYRRNTPSLALLRQMDTKAVLYGSDESHESNAIVDLLNEPGLQFEDPLVNPSPAAIRELEYLDVESPPLPPMGHHSIGPGFHTFNYQPYLSRT